MHHKFNKTVTTSKTGKHQNPTKFFTIRNNKNTDSYHLVSLFTNLKKHNNPLRQSRINVTLVVADLTGKHLVVAGKFSVPRRRNIDLNQILFIKVKFQVPLPLASIESYLNQPFSVFFFFIIIITNIFFFFFTPAKLKVLRRVPISDRGKLTFRFAIGIRFRVKTRQTKGTS
uniref:Uncharacterized protein n=1 Tax=Glycine max TaxID=3847 RepID=C6T9K7_SOYBN|nr:unknown [Glycine max]